MNNKIGETIEKQRKAKGLTQSELAKKIGVSNTAISKWENGNNLPDITLIEPLSEILGIDKLLLFTTKNDYTEEINARKKCTKRKHTIRLIILFIIYITSIIFTCLISFQVYKHKLEKIELNQSSIYKFYSYDNELFVKGFIIFKEKDNVILFEQLKYQNLIKIKEELNSGEIKYTNAELYFIIDGENIAKNIIVPDENISDDTNNVLMALSKSVKQCAEIDKEKMDEGDITIILDTDNKVIKRSIKVKISPNI